MDSFEWNKIFGAVLGTVLFIVALYIVVGGLMVPDKPKGPGMEIAVTEDGAGGPTTPTAELPPDWGTVLPAADVAAGENVHKRCLQCHDFAKGGPNKIGPNLWGVVGAKHAHVAGFTYSAAMQALAEKTWDYETLNHFLQNPKAAVPGTKMAFAGLSKTADRVNLIAFLRTLSDAPAPIPAPNPAAATPPAAPGAPAGAPADGTTGEPPAGEVQAPPPGTAPAPSTTPAPAIPPAGTTPAPATPAPAPPPAGGGGH